MNKWYKSINKCKKGLTLNLNGYVVEHNIAYGNTKTKTIVKIIKTPVLRAFQPNG